MNKQRSRSPFWQVMLFLILSILFSALPFVFALLLNKSSVVLAIGMAWYAVFPSVILLILAWILYHNESSWAVIAGRLAVSVGIWFGLQALFLALVRVQYPAATLRASSHSGRRPGISVGSTGFPGRRPGLMDCRTAPGS